MDDQRTDREGGYRMSRGFKIVLLVIFVPLLLIAISDIGLRFICTFIQN